MPFFSAMAFWAADRGHDDMAMSQAPERRSLIPFIDPSAVIAMLSSLSFLNSAATVFMKGSMVVEPEMRMLSGPFPEQEARTRAEVTARHAAKNLIFLDMVNPLFTVRQWKRNRLSGNRDSGWIRTIDNSTDRYVQAIDGCILKNRCLHAGHRRMHGSCLAGIGRFQRFADDADPVI